MAVDLLSQSLYQGVSLLWEKGQLTDLTLRCENQTFQAHRLVLAAHSSHLHHVLTESTDPVATLDMDQFNLSADSLQILLHYLYTGNIVVTEDSHRMLQAVAMTLNIKCLLTLLEAAKAEFVEQIPVVEAQGGEEMIPSVVAKGGEDVEIKEETESTGSLRPEADSGSVRESVDNVSGASKTADNTAESLPQPSVSQYPVEAKVQVIIPEATPPVKRKRGRPPKSAMAKSPTVKLTTAKSATPKSAKAKLATPKRTPKRIKKGDMEEDPEFIPETIGTVTLKKRKKVVKAKAKRGIRARKGKAETVDSYTPGNRSDLLWKEAEDGTHVFGGSRERVVGEEDDSDEVDELDEPQDQPDRQLLASSEPELDIKEVQGTLPHTGMSEPTPDGASEAGGDIEETGLKGDSEPGNTSWSCDVCDATFTRKDNLARHKKKHDGQMFTCGACGHKLYTKHALLSHIEVKHKNNLFRCSTCDKTYESAYGLKMHETTHTKTERFTCPYCGLGIAYRTQYVSHVARHQGVKPYRCTVCDQEFTHSGHLSAHRKICGTTKRKFKCNDCGKSFKAKKYLKAHALIHTGTQCFVCESCGMTFATRGGLYSHTQRKHP